VSQSSGAEITHSWSIDSDSCVCRDIHKDTGHEDFLGIVSIDMADLIFGVTEGWYDLQENFDLRGSEVSARSRLCLGEIRPMRPIQGALYLQMEASNPVQHLPKPPPKEPMEIYEEEVMAQVLDENRGANKRRRRMIIKDMWDEMLKNNPSAIQGYQKQLDLLLHSHVARMNHQVCFPFFPLSSNMGSFDCRPANMCAVNLCSSCFRVRMGK